MFVDRKQDIRAGFAALELSRDYSWARVRALGRLRDGRRQSVRRSRRRLRRDLREPAVRRRRYELLHPPADSADRRRARGAVRPQRLPELAAPFEGVRPVELRESGPPARAASVRTSISRRRCASRSTSTTSSFADTAVLEVARAAGARSIASSASMHRSRSPGVRSPFRTSWRRLSVAALIPGSGYEDLFGDDFAYSVLGNVVLTY